MKNRKLYLILTFAGLVSITLAILFVNYQRKVNDKKLGIKRATSQVVNLNQPEQINFPSTNKNSSDITYFSDETNGFYSLDNAGNRTVKCSLDQKDLRVRNLVYGFDGRSSVIFGTRQLNGEEITLFVDIKNCTKKNLDKTIFTASWSDMTHKFLYAKLDMNSDKSILKTANNLFEDSGFSFTVQGEVANVGWLDKNNIAFSYLSTDNSPADVYKIPIDSKKQERILKSVTDPSSISFSENGLLIEKTGKKDGFIVWRFENGVLVKDKEIRDSRLKNLYTLVWLSDRELVATTSDEYGNTKDVWLYDLDASKLWRLEFDRKGLQYVFSNFVRLDENRVVGFSDSIPYILSIK